MNNQDWLQKRLAEYEEAAKQASESGDYAQFQKWDFEANNIKALIKMNAGVLKMSDKQTMTVTFTNEGESMGIEFNYDPPLNEANQVTEEQRIMQNIAKGATYKVMEFIKQGG